MAKQLSRMTARSIAHQHARDAGLDVNTADAVVQALMVIFDPELTVREWINFVEQEIQHHANP